MYLIWGLGLLGASALLLAVELFVPSYGMIAVTASIAAIAGVVCLFIHDTTWGMIGMFGVIVAGPTAFFLWVKLFPHTPMGRRMILGNPNINGDDAPQDSEQVRRREEALALIGVAGTALTDLRPVGVAEIDGKRVDVLAEGPWVAKGRTVKVVHLDGLKIVVREVEG